MAIYHFDVSSVSRRLGQSAVAAWAYISGTRQVDARTDSTYDYRRKAKEILASGEVGPADWQATERAEKRWDAMTVESGTTIEVFLSFLDHMLCPALRPGQTVLLDNLRAHKNRAVIEKIEATGARVVFLPRYSPDFQPIEGVFSKLKSFLRCRAARTPAALERAIAQGLATITPKDARGFFRHCGFAPKAQPS